MIKNYFTIQYLFSNPVPSNWASDKNYLILSSILVLVAIGLWFFKKATKDKLQKRLIQRWYRMLWTIGLLGLLWSLLNYELVPYLAAHWLVWVIYLWGIGWAAKIVYFMQTKYKEDQNTYSREQIKNKYI